MSHIKNRESISFCYIEDRLKSQNQYFYPALSETKVFSHLPLWEHEADLPAHTHPWIYRITNKTTKNLSFMFSNAQVLLKNFSNYRTNNTFYGTSQNDLTLKSSIMVHGWVKSLGQWQDYQWLSCVDILWGCCPIGINYGLCLFHLSKTAFTNYNMNSDRYIVLYINKSYIIEGL